MTLFRRFAIYLWLLPIVVLFGGQELSAQAMKHYIVQLRDEPVILQMARRTPGAPRWMELKSAEASSFRSQLATKQSDLKRRVESFTNARVEAQVDTVYNGLFVAMRPEDAEALKLDPEVQNVFPSIQYHKSLDAALPLVNAPQAWANAAIGGEANAGAGVRIAIIDTGIDINHPMFQDPSLTAPSGYPLFRAPTQQCNRSDQQYTNSKVIVARSYVSLLENPDQNCDAQDLDGHGTFVAGVAAGRRVTAPLASIAGMAPKAYLGSYKIYGTPGTNDLTPDRAIIAAVEDAVKDGMNVINLSSGAPVDSLPALDPLSVSVANAVRSGVTVVASAGNEGPGTGKITSPAISPAAITVGMTTNSRVLAPPLVITANLPLPAGLDRVVTVSGNGPKVTANIGPAALVDVATVSADATGCTALPARSLAGEIVLIPRGPCTFALKIQNAANAGAILAVIYNNQTGQPPTGMIVGSATGIPAVMIGNVDGLALARFLASPSAKVQATLEAQKSAIPATPNRMVLLSSNGPSTDFDIKPDLVAPGSPIYSAEQRNYPAGPQYDESGFGVSAGTSFSAPLVAGAAALVKQASPGLTPDQIKSLLVNTAAKTVTSARGGTASVLSQGNGLLDLSAALAAPIVASPVSVSFGLHQQGDLTFGPRSITITNISQRTDVISVSNTPSPGSARATIRLSPPAFLSPLSPGESAVVSFTASPFPESGTVEGYLSFQSQNSQTSITVPYWGTYVKPSVDPSGVVSAAGLSLGSSSLAPGEIISIFGTNLANQEEYAVTLPLPASLGGAGVTIGGKTAALVYVSSGQINAQVPFELDGASAADLVVTLNGFSSPPVRVPIAAVAPGIYTLNQGGTGRAAILHASDSTLVSSSNPARPGEFLELFTTGLGSVFPVVSTGAQGPSDPLARTRLIPSATIAGLPVTIGFAGLAPGYVGLYQLNLQVPNGVSSGEQTLIVTSNGVASNPATVVIGQ